MFPEILLYSLIMGEFKLTRNESKSVPVENTYYLINWSVPDSGCLDRLKFSSDYVKCGKESGHYEGTLRFHHILQTIFCLC